jgi:DNA-binding transcriptional regulator YiaG
MTPEALRAALTTLGMSQRGLADALAMDERQVRRWFAGAVVPDDAAAWIALAVRELPPLHAAIDEWHQNNPPPRRAGLTTHSLA